jgi:hypothetical protein
LDFGSFRPIFRRPSGWSPYSDDGVDWGMAKGV